MKDDIMRYGICYVMVPGADRILSTILLGKNSGNKV